MAKPTDKDVVRKIGIAALADALGITPVVVKKWTQRSIPWKHRPRVAQIAVERGVKLPADFLYEQRRAA